MIKRTGKRKEKEKNIGIIYIVCLLLSLVANFIVVDPKDLFARKRNPIVNAIVLLVANMHQKEPNVNFAARSTTILVVNKYSDW
jgi:hypothetical protein